MRIKCAWVIAAALMVCLSVAPVYLHFAAMREMVKHMQDQDREIIALRHQLEEKMSARDAHEVAQPLVRIHKKSSSSSSSSQKAGRLRPPHSPPPTKPAGTRKVLPLPMEQTPSVQSLRPSLSTSSSSTSPIMLQELSSSSSSSTSSSPSSSQIPQNYSSIFEELCMLNFKGIVEGGPRRCCKGMTEQTRRRLVHDMAPFIALQPAAPLYHLKPPFYSKDRLNCHTERWRGSGKIFTGEARKPGGIPLVVDLFIVGSEMDLLEARLYELIESVDYVILGHSPHNHRGDVQPHWFKHARDNQGRFGGPHSERIILVDVSMCDDHVREVSEHSKNHKAQDFIMDIQSTQRHCLWRLGVKMLRKRLGMNSTLTKKKRQQSEDAEHLPEVPDNTIFIFSDADELPDRELIYHLKHCDIYSSALPSHMRMRVQGHNFRVRCSDGIKKQTGASEIAEWRTIKEDNGIIYRFRAPPTLKKREKGYFNQAGVHMTWYGSMAFVDYKGFSHAEGGYFPPLLVGPGAPGDYCDATAATLAKRQEIANSSPLKFVRFWEKQPIQNLPPVPKTQAGKAALYRCQLPWLAIENHERFKWFWGDGTLEDLNKLKDVRIWQ